MKFSSVIVLCISVAFARKGFGPTDQEWGFVTVREGAHIFWWLHQTNADVENYTERPLIIWLQGGPGASSTGYGNFAELGPLDPDLNPRPTTWLNNYNILFVDSPVGTGYSHVDSPAYLTTNNSQIAEDFLVLLKGFYEVVPELKDTPLYIFSESYGGKAAVEIALVVDKANKDGSLDVKLEGIGLGDAWISPIDSVLSWAPYLLNLGAVDQNGYELIQKIAKATKAAVDRKDYSSATVLWGQTELMIGALTENIDFYNILTEIPTAWKERSTLGLAKSPLLDEIDSKIKTLMNHEVREALSLNVTWGDQSSIVFKALRDDFMRPVTDLIELLLNTTDVKVAVFNGQLDLIVDTPGTIKWVDQLKFEGSKKWKTFPRKPIVVNDVIEGYFKKIGNFGMYWINRAGHMVPSDNPAAMNYILEDMIDGDQDQPN